jgi:protein-tyrosine phosphatase
MKILMVCLGNICRSPLAEGILQHKANEANLAWEVESAGTNGLHNGEAPHELSQHVAWLNGIDISNQKSRQFVAEDFQQYDKIYALAKDVMHEIKSIAGTAYQPEKIDLLLNVLYPGKNKDVPDPWYSGESQYHTVYAMIEEACTKIVTQHESLLKK